MRAKKNSRSRAGSSHSPQAYTPPSAIDKLYHEKQLWQAGLTRVIGVDEAGRGPLAGPVVAAAIVFSPEKMIAGVDDSKKLTQEERLRLFPQILRQCRDYGVGIVSAEEIDEVNILQASLLAMRKAILNLHEPPEHVLVDGRTRLGMDVPQTTIIKGDALSHTIGAASIVAKVVRDLIMDYYHRKFPGYGFDVHKGYPTPHHLRILQQLGPCAIHRRSFRPRALQNLNQY
ncbi:ribonuclease HII [candidate division KSB1 bacterium]|nr:ribonuclease HII [candidate division KSB1 bacterium]